MELVVAGLGAVAVMATIRDWLGCGRPRAAAVVVVRGRAESSSDGVLVFLR